MTDFTKPDDLYRLARSGQEIDRRELALAMHDVLQTQAHPVAADILLLLLKEAEHDLRVLLAGKLAACPACPFDLIRFLVYETPLSVSEPVLRHSPLLDDAELLQIIDHFTNDPSYLHALAQRQTVSAHIAARLLERGDETAHLLLLQNRGAELNDICLDYLVDLAKKRPALQQPLLQRREVTPAIAAKLYGIVSAELRQHIKDHFPLEREWLDEAVDKAVSMIITEKIELKQGTFVLTDDVKIRAERLKANGAIGTKQAMEALRKGDVPLFVCVVALVTHTRPEKIMQLLIGDTVETLAIVAHIMRLGRVEFNALYLLWRRQAQPHTILHERDISHAQNTYHGVDGPRAQLMVQNWQIAASQ